MLVRGVRPVSVEIAEGGGGSDEGRACTQHQQQHQQQWARRPAMNHGDVCRCGVSVVVCRCVASVVLMCVLVVCRCVCVLCRCITVCGLVSVRIFTPAFRVQWCVYCLRVVVVRRSGVIACKLRLLGLRLQC